MRTAMKRPLSLLCTWNDNSVVTVLSSANSVKPLTVAVSQRRK